MVTPDTTAALLLRPKAGTKLNHVQDDEIYSWFLHPPSFHHLFLSNDLLASVGLLLLCSTT